MKQNFIIINNVNFMVICVEIGLCLVAGIKRLKVYKILDHAVILLKTFGFLYIDFGLRNTLRRIVLIWNKLIVLPQISKITFLSKSHLIKFDVIQIHIKFKLLFMLTIIVIF